MEVEEEWKLWWRGDIGDGRGVECSGGREGDNVVMERSTEAEEASP